MNMSIKKGSMMLVKSIKPTNSFTGIARIDYNKTQSEVDKCPPHTREAIWGNINTLKDRFEKGPDKVAKVSFTYTPSHELVGWQGVGKIKVEGENQTVSKDFDLRKSTSAQEIWEDGFEDVTQKVLDDSFDVKNDKADEIIEKILHTDDKEVKKEVYDIADKLTQTSKIRINQYETAARIYSIANEGYTNKEEIKNCLINNFNQTAQRFQNDLPSGVYRMSLTYENFSCSHFTESDYYVSIERDKDSDSEKSLKHLVLVYFGLTYGKDFKPKDARLDNADKAFQKLHDEFVWFAYEN